MSRRVSTKSSVLRAGEIKLRHSELGRTLRIVSTTVKVEKEVGVMKKIQKMQMTENNILQMHMSCTMVCTGRRQMVAMMITSSLVVNIKTC